jgi:hypothetical protein
MLNVKAKMKKERVTNRIHKLKNFISIDICDDVTSVTLGFRIIGIWSFHEKQTRTRHTDRDLQVFTELGVCGVGLIRWWYPKYSGLTL